MSRPLGEILRQIHEAAPGGLSAPDTMRLARELSQHYDGLAPVRLVLLSSFTTTLFDAHLKVEGARHGFAVDVVHGGFGQFEQVMLQDDWRASEGTPEVMVLTMRLEDLDPDVGFRYHSGEGRPFATLADDALGRIGTTLDLFRERSQGVALVANFAVPEPRPLSVFDANDPGSLSYRVQELNRTLLEQVSGRPGCHVWDYAGLVASRGSATWTDPRLWGLARTPVAAANQPAYAAHLARTLRGVLGPASKCLVLDLDHTLWGGALGDEGVGGIQLGDEHPGSAFKRFQRAVLGLRDRGILLAICSKNDEEVVLEALEDHPEMLVKRDHFAAMRINWNPKSQNLRAIAEELNIGLDSLVFFDDNPVERAEVRDRASDVLVVEVPGDPVLYVDALAGVAAFDIPALTEEDRHRAQSYQQQRERTRSEQGAESMEDFLVSLEMRAEIGLLDGRTAQRIGQLVGKTNQFNLTTRRHSQADLEAIAVREGAEVHWLRLGDRYGDLGLIAIGVILPEGDSALIDSLVLSCRAANRGVEQAMVAHLADRAAALGYESLVGEYIPTARNHVVKDLYPSLGFALVDTEGEGTRYRLDLAEATIEPPDYLDIRGFGAD